MIPIHGDEIIPKLTKRLEGLKGKRSVWEGYWEDLSIFNLPQKNNVYGGRVNGEDMQYHLYDSTSVHANELLSSALHGMLTNPMTTFFSLSTGTEATDRIEAVTKWLEDSTQIVHNILDSSNFQTEIHEVYLDLGGFGTGAIYIEEDDDDHIRFESYPIYELHIDEGKKGMVDTVFKSCKKTIRSLADEFGMEWMDEALTEALKEKPETEYEYCQAVFPRTDLWFHGNQKRLNKNHPKRMKYASFHFIACRKVLIKEGGYKEFPFAVPRWSKQSGEMYGRGPSMKALPDTKSLNSLMETALRAGKVALAPPVQVSDQGVMRKVRLVPGAVNYVRPGSEIKPIFTGQDFRGATAEMIEMRTRIRQAFFIDQLQMDTQGPAMTATEVMQRTEEKLRLMGPVLGRQQFELLRPLIERVVNILARKGLLPEPPAEMQEAGVLKIKYSSMIAKAQKVSELDNFNRFYALAQALIQVDPQSADVLDSDSIIREAAHLLSVKQVNLRGKKDVEAIRKGRAEQRAAAEKIQKENMESQTVGNLSKAGADAAGTGQPT